jgi:sugar phosphate isomerase/epimerase
MKLSFMTLGCPAWDLDTVLRRAKEYGFDGVDFRGLKDEPKDISLTKEFTSELKTTKRRLEDAGLEVSCISSDMRVCDAKTANEHVESARRIIPIAIELNCKFVRVFGGGDLKSNSINQLAAEGQKTIEKVLKLDGADQVQWVFETHDNWVSSKDCKLLTDAVASPNFGILWDMAHTSRTSKESPQQTLELVGDRVRYLHIKDAKHDPTHPDIMKDGWRYVSPGEGDLPIEKGIRSLLDRGYNGWFTFEHEKRWQPKLEEPEVAFRKFSEWMQKKFQAVSAK